MLIILYISQCPKLLQIFFQIYLKHEHQYHFNISYSNSNSSATSFNMKNHSTEQKLHDKKGSRTKKSHCKKIAANS